MKAKQICYRCKKEKPLGQFKKRIDERYYRMCQSCVSEVTARKGTGRKRLAHTADERTCYLCLRVLPNACFTRRSTGTYFSACKECNRFVFAHRRRARLKGAEGSFTAEEFRLLVAKTEKCPDCGRLWADIPPHKNGFVITADHIRAVTKGGSNRIENIRPLCYSCNSKKGNRDQPGLSGIYTLQ